MGILSPGGAADIHLPPLRGFRVSCRYRIQGLPPLATDAAPLRGGKSEAYRIPAPNPSDDRWSLWLLIVDSCDGVWRPRGAWAVCGRQVSLPRRGALSSPT